MDVQLMHAYEVEVGSDGGASDFLFLMALNKITY